MAAMMTSMAVGGAVGQNIAGTMNNMMNGNLHQSTVTPPPIPQSVYYIAVNGQPNGPYNIQTLAQMTGRKEILPTTLVWKDGMTQWERAGQVEELKPLFGNTMPPIPSE